MTMAFARARRLGAERRYRQLRQISQDHLGSVWTADDMMWHRTVTVRVIDDALASDEDFMSRLELATEELMKPLVGEGRIRARIFHPNAARPLGLDPGGAGSPPLLVMEPVDGLPLEAFLRQAGRPSPDIVVGAILAIAGALHAAHEVGVVHGAVNPSNVLLDSQGMVKVVDFGVAAAWVSTPGLVDPGSSLSAYMAPELLAGAPPTPLSDGFSVGAILGHMLLGRPGAPEGMAEASPTPTPSGEVADRIARLCRPWLAEDPESRPHSLMQLMNELSALPFQRVASPKRRWDEDAGEAYPLHPERAWAETKQPIMPIQQGDRPMMRPSSEPSVEVALRASVLARAGRRRDWSRSAEEDVPRFSERPSGGADAPRPRRWIKRLIVGIGCALVVSLAAALSISWLGWGGAFTAHGSQSPRASTSSSGAVDRRQAGPSKVIVPRLRGLTVSQAQLVLVAIGLKVESLKPVLGTPDIIQKSKPAWGKSVRRGTGLVLFVGVTKERLQNSG